MFSPDIILCGWLGSKHQLTNLNPLRRCLLLSLFRVPWSVGDAVVGEETLFQRKRPCLCQNCSRWLPEGKTAESAPMYPRGLYRPGDWTELLLPHRTSKTPLRHARLIHHRDPTSKSRGRERGWGAVWGNRQISYLEFRGQCMMLRVNSQKTLQVRTGF